MKDCCWLLTFQQAACWECQVDTEQDKHQLPTTVLLRPSLTQTFRFYQVMCIIIQFMNGTLSRKHRHKNYHRLKNNVNRGECCIKIL